MSTVSSLNRQNRVYTTSVQTPASDGTSTILYASVGNFPNVATIKSVKATLSTGTLTNPTISILNNGAAHKIAPTALFPTATAVAAATTAVLPSTAAIIYANGAAGVGATLTRGENGALGTIDGVTLAVNDRILVKNQASALQNGIYVVTAVGSGGAPYVLTRATDADQGTTEERYGLATTVTSGLINGGKKFFMNNSAAITMGTTAITFIEYTALANSFIEGSATGTASGQEATATFTSPGVNWQDASHSNCLNLAVSMAGAIPSGGRFTLDIEYTPLQEFSLAGDSTGIKADTTWRVLRQPSTGNAIDITDEVRQNFNPYGLGADNASLSVVALSVSSDKLYIGSEKIFNKILIHPHASSYIGAGISLTAEYWNGSSWVAISQLFDNTSDQQATASTMSYPGVISFAAPGNWAKQKLATDPMTVYEDAILAGNAFPPGMMVHPSRYFIRLSIASLASPLRVVKVLPIV